MVNKKILKRLERYFSVSTGDMRRIVSDFQFEMKRGLAGKKSSLKMIPTYVHRPSGSEKGSYIALDLGGTNFRILEVTLKGGARTSAPKVMKFALKKNQITGSGEMLFDFLAGCLKTFLKKYKICPAEERRLGFTFSFPVRQTGIASGSLVCWTKGFSARGVVGKDVVKLLAQALDRQGLSGIKVAALANDTVGTMVTRSYEDPDCDMGVIIGTGTNACYPEETYNGKDEMIINIEWGNFNKLKKNVYDKRLDAASANPKEQILEKMVSGLYLGEVTRLVLNDMVKKGAHFRGLDKRLLMKPYGLDTKDMSDLAVRKSTDAGLRQIIGMISARASRIAAACMAAIITRMDPGLSRRHTIAIDGSVYEKYPDFSKNVRLALKELLGKKERRIKTVLAKDGSGKGAAIIAAVSLI